MKEMQLVKHSLQLARRHNQSFQLNTDRRLNRERSYPLPVFWQTTKDLLFDIELCSAKHVSRHGINRKLKISTCKIKNFGLTNRGHMGYPFWEVKRETRKTVKILFALHYIRTGCEINSTNWAGDAFRNRKYLSEGMGPGRRKRQRIWNVTLLSDISAGQCMFRRYVFFTAKIWMVQMVEAGISIYRKERTPAENRTAASSEETVGFFTENVVA